MFEKNKKSPRNGEKEEMSLPQALLAASVLLGLMFWLFIGRKPNVLNKVLFDYFEYAYFGGYALITALCLLALYQLIMKTSHLKERYHQLFVMSQKSDDSILVGATKDKISLHLSDKDRTTHVQIIGSTGRGKTESVIIPWASRDAMRGKSFVVIDGKGSPQMMERILENADRSGCNHKILRFDLNDITKSISINPLSSGTPQQIVDRLFAALLFEEPFYKNVQSDICRNLTSLLHFNDKEVTFKRLHTLLTDDATLAEEIGKCRDLYTKTNVMKFLRQSKKEREKNVMGLVTQIAPFATGELSQVVNAETRNMDPKQVSISDMVQYGGFCSVGHYGSEKRPFGLVVSIPTLKYQESGHILGKLILQDIAGAIGYRENRAENDFLSIFLDEFSEFVFPSFISSLNKARSANVAFHLSHQSMGDLDDVNEGFAKAVMTNTNVKCILGLNDPDTADYFARHFGTYTEEKKTEQVDGEIWGEAQRTGKMSLREVESFKISPNQLKSFNQGTGVLHLPSLRGSISEVIQYNAFDKQRELPRLVKAEPEKTRIEKNIQVGTNDLLGAS